MKIFYSFTALALLALPLAAQSPLSTGQKGIYTMIKNNVVKAAQKMPEANYSFRPTPDIRTFGQLVAHVADAQYLFCSAALGEKNPSPGVEKGIEGKTKADLVQALQDAFGYCDKVYDGMTDARAAETVKFFGREQAKLTVLSFNNAHNDEHYGNIVTYMRLKGLVPPSSEAQSK